MASTMEISWLGQSCFKLRGREATVVLDPSKDLPARFAASRAGKAGLTADLVLITHRHHDHDKADLVGSIDEQASLQVFDGAGEYEVKGVLITGIPSFHDSSQGSERGANIIYHLLIDGLNVVHLGDLGQKKLTEDQIQQISQTDILLIPVGGVYTIDGKEAAEIVAQLEPKIVIPMHYKINGLKFELEGVDKFLKEMGAENTQIQPKLVITKEKLPEESMVVVLSI